MDWLLQRQPAIDCLRDRFHLERLVMVGDRGMISHKAIEALREQPGGGWISALKSTSIRSLIKQGELQRSTGSFGMFGISWGGFNFIRMALRAPPALKAVVPVDATEDLYQDDVHYMDGIIHVDSWEMSQDLDNARPGAPDYVIDEAYFENRFDTEPWMLTYKAEQRDGPFWDGASARDRYDELAVPMYHIGGWYDGYRDSLPRMLASADVPQSDGHTQVQFDSGFTQQLRERQVRGTADVAREEVVELHAGELRGNWFEIAFGHTLTVFAEAFPALVHDVVE